MNRTLLCLLFVALAALCPARAQGTAPANLPLAGWTTPENLPLGPQVLPTFEKRAGGYDKIAWQGVDGRMYLVQFSSNLATWNFVPAVIPGADNPQSMLLHSDAHALFYRLYLQDGLTIDPEATVLPDWWQLVYFGATGQAPGADPDGDGTSNLDEYKAGTSPVDFYNGVLYNVWIAGGGDQRLAPGQYSPEPFSVSVNYGMTNSPVTFMAGAGGVQLSATNGGPLSTTLTVCAGADGKASVYLYLPAGAPVDNMVTACASTIAVSSTGGECQNLSVTTHVYKTDPSVDAPSGVTVVPTSATTILVTWTNNSNGGTLIETSEDDGVTWQTAAELASGVSFFELNGNYADAPVRVRVSAKSPSGAGGSAPQGAPPTNPVEAFSVQVIKISKSSEGRSYPNETTGHTTPYVGWCRWGGWANGSTSEKTVDDSAVTPEYLDNLLGGIAYPADPPPLTDPGVTHANLDISNISVVTQAYQSAVGEHIDSEASSLRFWIKAPASDHDQAFHFLKVVGKHTYPDYDDDTTEIVSVTPVNITIPADKTVSPPTDLESVPPLVPGSLVYLSESLVLTELYSDINNDGKVNQADGLLTGKPYQNGASEEEKDKGTEFIFLNDNLSNGAWDKDDTTTPGKPADADDDDAKEIHAKPGITSGEVWLDHPAIAGLKFYKTRKCTEEIQLSPAHHFTISATNPWPGNIFMRAEENINFPADNPQVEGDLRLMIKPNVGTNVIEGAKMKLTVVKELGAKKYFQAVRDYILENNTKTFTQEKQYGTATRYRIVAMREESTQMFGLDTYDHAADKARLKGIDEVKANFPLEDVIINGNQCFFSGFYFLGSMTDRCDGRLCIGRNILRPPSDDIHNPHLGGPTARYIGYKSGEPEIINGQFITPSEFTFSTGQIPEASPATPDQGIGGLAAKYDRAELQQSENQAIGRAPVTEPGKGIVFTATTYVGNAGDAIDFAHDAHASGVKPLNGGDGSQWELLFLDGSTSVGLVLTNPDGVQKTLIKGAKHDGYKYYINTYLLFECGRPRNQ